MRPRLDVFRSALALASLLLLVTALPTSAHGGPPATTDHHLGPGDRLSLLKTYVATARFLNITAAERAGYEILRDAQQIACIDNPGVGGMGIHYVKGDLVVDPAIDALKPEALVYEPQRNGRLKLVAVEYVVLQSAWDATNTRKPKLFGQEFALVPAGNRYGLPPFYELHAWIWEFNPLGLFDDWNPRVRC